MSKMPKFLKVLCVMVIIAIIAFSIWLTWALYELRYGYDETRNISDYTGRYDLTHKYESTDIFSLLLGFPENTEDIEVEEYLLREKVSLFTTPYQIMLHYTMSEEKYATEKERLLNLSTSYNGIKKEPIFIEDVCGGDALIITYDRGLNYEYVILREETREIICVFIQRDDLMDSQIPEEYWVEPSMVEGLVPEKYNMYSFGTIQLTPKMMEKEALNDRNEVSDNVKK